MAEVKLEAVDRLGPDDLSAVLRLVRAAAEVDGVAPLNDHTMLHVKRGAAGDLNLLARDGESLAGYAHLDLAEPEAADAELVVAPDHRGRGIGRALLGEVVEQTDGRPVRLWAHGRLPGAARLAATAGFRSDRVLLRMTRPLGPAAPPLPDPAWPAGVTLRSFEVGRDEAAWLRVNARAFADLPDQGGWTLADLTSREAEPWFDPAGFFLTERDGQLVGFHWTKIHGGTASHIHRPVGEVYVVGVDPAAQGLGLGKALTVAGLQHLQAAGLDEVMLYVDEANTSAVRLYTTLGFTVADADARFTNAPNG